MEKKEKKWRSEKKLPKILRINRVKGLSISVLFSDGHNRILDFVKIFNKWGVDKKDFEYKLTNPLEFKKVRLENYTLSWPNVLIKTQGFDGRQLELSYSLAPEHLYELSEPDEVRERFPIGLMIKKARIRAGLTQEELGKRIGLDKFYISRVEANKLKIELATLRKIVEGGLHKRLEIIIK